MKIAVRFGHQIKGADTGSSSIVSETDVNRRYGKLVINKLKELGYDVINVTPPTIQPTLSKSLFYGINMANNNHCDLFISCHVNAGFNSPVDYPVGCECLYTKESKMAQNICNELEKLGFKNRGAKKDVRGLAEIKHTNCIIIEPFFTDGIPDCNLYKKVGDEGIANAIVKGITGKNPIQPSPQNKIEFQKILHIGDKNDFVKQVQQLFNQVLNPAKEYRIIENGYYTKEFAFNVVKKFQTENNVKTPDGVFDKETFDLLVKKLK